MPKAVLVFMLSAVASACNHNRTDVTGDIDARDQAVFNVVLDSMFARPNRGRIASLIVIDHTTIRVRERLIPGFLDSFYELPGVDSSTVLSFESRSRESHAVPKLGPVVDNMPVVLINRAALDSLPRGDAFEYWRRFYKKYPKSSGSISFSSIGYNRAGDVAVLMVDHGCDALCGTGHNVSLRKINGKWRITKAVMTWVS